MIFQLYISLWADFNKEHLVNIEKTCFNHLTYIKESL
jgi:hypothetical protein